MKLKQSNWILGAIFFAAGLLMLIMPNIWIKLIVTLFGAGAIAISIYNIVYTNKNFTDDNYKKMILIKSIVGIVFGLIAVLFTFKLISVIAYIFAVYLIVASVFGFYTVTLLKETGVDRKRYIVENLAMLVAAILIFLITPEKLGKTIIQIFGVVALVTGIILLAVEFVPKLINKKNEIEVSKEDVTVVDDTPAATKVPSVDDPAANKTPDDDDDDGDDGDSSDSE